MKTVIYFLAIVALVVAAEEEETHSITSSFGDILEAIRDDMPCGFPLLGIGPLAPVFISNLNVDVDTPALKVQGAVQNFTVNNLDSFVTLNTKHNPIKRKFVFSLLFENVEIDTGYDLAVDYQESGWTVKVQGAGNANVAFKGFVLSVTAKYSISVINTRVNLKSLKIVPQLEGFTSNIEGIFGSGPVNRKWNEELEKSVPAVVNIFAEAIAAKVEAIVLPEINKFLYQYNLLDILGGIGGNSVNGKKIKCEHPEQKVISS